MSKFFLFSLAVISLPMLSCTPADGTAQQKPIKLESNESDLPWNRPQPGEGGGPLGFLQQ